MSTEDREVLREVWEGRIPAVFRLAEEDCSKMEPPDVAYLMLPRLSYLPIATDKVRKHFVKFVSEELADSEMWFSSGGIPLKWHRPIGVLYDLSNQTKAGSPWDITVHFTNFPHNQLIPCASREVVESHFMSCIKEADQLKHAGRVVSTMQKKDHNQLWLGLQNDKFDQFWTINRRLMETPSGDDNFKHIPVRFYLKEDQSVVQRLVKPVCDDGREVATLGQLVQGVLPVDRPVRFVTQGIEPNLDAPLQWLSQHLSYPDNFLHIAVH